ncbi:MAG TPA: type II secretion system protein [Polyangiaceae bacterium]|nr:type II secretion system protein [Polyangiaceae bacterium]
MFLPQRILGTRRSRKAQRGFTLTELMIVVTLVGILASVGIASFRKRVAASKTTEAASVVQAIRGAEEAFRSENQVYLNVSSVGAWYPSKGQGSTITTWEQKTHTDLAAWQRLGARVTQPVQFGYLVNAGRAGDALPALNIDDKSVNLGKPTDAWYLIQARSDSDKDGVYCNVLANSFTPELYVEHEGE